jgi:hypothetical protein
MTMTENGTCFARLISRGCYGGAFFERTTDNSLAYVSGCNCPERLNIGSEYELAYGEDSRYYVLREVARVPNN